jgi:hypothetical protein
MSGVNGLAGIAPGHMGRGHDGHSVDPVLRRRKAMPDRVSLTGSTSRRPVSATEIPGVVDQATTKHGTGQLASQDARSLAALWPGCWTRLPTLRWP